MLNPIFNVFLVEHMVEFICYYEVDPLKLKVLAVCHDKGGVRKNATSRVDLVQELDFVLVEHDPCSVNQDIAHLLLSLLRVSGLEEEGVQNECGDVGEHDDGEDLVYHEVTSTPSVA